ncbi:MAG: peptide ABC transporter substrate-binding protein [Alphaproteobacteria bacterium]
MLSFSAFAVTLNLHNGGDVTSLDPHKVSGDWENRVVGDIFEGLMTEDVYGKPILGAAASYEMSEDGLTYTFKLKEGLKWSDGSPLTAHDFEYAFKRLFNPATAASYAWLQFAIKNSEEYNKGEVSADEVGVKALDDTTIRFDLKEPTPFFLGVLTHYTAYPVPQKVVEKYGDAWVKLENIIVNGPYKPTEWIPGSHIKSVINDQWYDVPSLKIDEVVYTTLENVNTALRTFEAGDFDWITGYPKDQFKRIQKETPEVLRVVPMAGSYYYVINHNKEPFNDADIRKALSMSINREAITNNVIGSGEQPSYSWVPPGMDNYGDPVKTSWADEPYNERVAEAKKILESKGYNKKNPLKLVLRYNTDENHKRVAIAVAAMWKAINIETELFNNEVKVHYSDLREGDFDIGRAGWLADYNDPTNFLALLQTGYGNNYGKYSNAEYDSLLAQAGKEVDLKKRAGILAQAEKIAMDETAAIPLYYYVTENLLSPKIKGWENNVFDIHRTRWISKED